MNAKITVKPVGDGTRGGYINVFMSLFGDDGETPLSETEIEQVIINDPSIVNVTVDEINERYHEIKSGLYRNGEGMHEHQIYKMAAVELVAERVSRKWIIQ